MPESNDTYPGTEMGGTYCANCHLPITPDGDCHCGWNHRTQQRITSRAQFFDDVESTQEETE